MPKPYDVLDVCYLVIKICNDNRYIISNLKLQKVLYFIQAYFVSKVEDGTKCFIQEIEAWPYGPVVKKAYNEYKVFGSGSIPVLDFRCESVPGSIINIKRIPYNQYIISKKDARNISEVIHTIGNYSAFDLVRITHKEGSPWHQVYREGERNIISIESIREYYNK